MSTLFISDLHLSQEQPHITELFLTFLRDTAPQADALYILGDLFEVWLGDDMSIPAYQACIDALQTLSQNGLAIYVMYGNRDFLMREQFESHSGAHLIHEPYVINLYDTPTLLLHGDILCTDDLKYQQLRTQFRNADWQTSFLALTPAERLAQAQKYREGSKKETAQKAEQIMDVTQQAVEQTMQQHQVYQLIHGHTHRPAIHEFSLNDKTAKRIVLSDWGQKGYYFQVDQQGIQQHESQ